MSVFAQDEELVESEPDRIWTVDIEGNETFEDLVIKKYISNEAPSIFKKITFFARSGYVFSETEIRKDVIRIERFYQRRGFNDVEVTYRIEERRLDWKKDLTFVVTENSPIIINNVDVEIRGSASDSAFIQADSDFQKMIRRLPYREGRRFESIEEPEVLGKIKGTLNNLGFPYNSTTIEASIDTLSKQADLNFKISPGPRATFDSVIVEGETTLDEKYIRRETGIKSGNYFSENSMRDAQREVFKHHLFRLALVSIPDQPRDSTLDVLLRVKELPLRSVQLQFGAGNFDRLDEPLSFYNFYKLFRGQATWVYRNVRGRGEQFSTSGRLSYYQRKISAEYLFPYVYNTKSSISIEPFYEFRDEQSYDILTGGIINTFGYEYNENLTGTFAYEFAVNDESNVPSESQFGTQNVLPDSLLSYNKSSFSINFYYTKGLQRGRRGLIIQPSIEFSGLFGESTFSYQKAFLDVRKYTELNNSLVLATRVQGGGIYYAKQDSLPSDVRYYLGGTNSVRGWSRQGLGPKREVSVVDTADGNNTNRMIFVPTGGRVIFGFNAELRQQLNKFVKGFGVAAFIDGGQVWRRFDEISPGGLQFGVGGGLRYQSPIGPIRLDLGYKLNPSDADLKRFSTGDEGSAWDRWELHISIGQAF